MLKRSIETLLDETLRMYGKMAFVSGPRQVGKTTAARNYLVRFPQGLYFNWDSVPDQKRLIRDPYFFESENRDPGTPFLIVLDEIHKYQHWKNYLKGAYDTHHDEFRFLVTGSGRLDLFKKGGDSLMGRYMSIPLFPLSVGELAETFPGFSDFTRALRELPAEGSGARSAFEHLYQFSGFPEPFLRATRRFYNQWFPARKQLLVRSDIRDSAVVHKISLLEMLSHLLPERIGSPLSINSLREDVGVAFETIRDWLLLLESFHYCFRIAPFGARLNRMLKKEKKLYLHDWVEVPDSGARFENMVASHLFKAVALWRAAGDGEIGLYYIRDKEKREVDFVITEKSKPTCLIECKLSAVQLDPSLLYYQQKFAVPVAVQILHKTGVCKKLKRAGFVQWIVSADRWLEVLP